MAMISDSTISPVKKIPHSPYEPLELYFIFSWYILVFSQLQTQFSVPWLGFTVYTAILVQHVKSVQGPVL